MKQTKTIPFLAVIVVACGASKRVELSVEGLERNDLALRAQQAELQRKFEDLSNSLMVLQDRLETLKVAAERQPLLPAPGKGKRGPKAGSVSNEAEEAESVFGFGGSTERHSRGIQLTNRDLERIDRQITGREPVKEPAKPEEDRGALSTVDNPEAARSYNEAFKKFEDGNYADAIRRLGEFAAKYPLHVYADNAVFWIGESYFRMRDFAKAAEQFERVGKEFPAGNKVPDAFLRAASCYLRLNRPAEAQKAFERITQIYPQSVAAQKAKASLAEMSDISSDPRRM